jgi:hypothetical protein
MKEHKVVQRLLASSWSPCSLAIELESCSEDRMLSFDVLFVTIADAVKIAQFLSFSKAIAFGFFHGKKSTLKSGDGSSQRQR